MKVGRFALIVGAAVATITSACARRSELNPMGESARASVSLISIEMSGSKLTDASTVGARGRREAVRRSTSEAGYPSTYSVSVPGVLVDLLILGAVAAKRTADMQPVLVVDDARAGLQNAMQESDFAGLLGARLAASHTASGIRIAAVAISPATASLFDAAGNPVHQVVTLDYRLLLHRPEEVNPDIGLVARVAARVLSPDRQRLFYTASWTYCGERLPFVQMGSGNGAALRQQINSAAAILAEAMLYDLYVNKKPRKAMDGCMDFADLPRISTGQPS